MKKREKYVVIEKDCVFFKCLRDRRVIPGEDQRSEDMSENLTIAKRQ